jgi:glycosyltransferase involved in cell wall biosynthesis
MDKKIRIRQIFGTHQIYQEIVNYPPKGVEYQHVGKSTSEGQYYESKKTKEFLGAILQKLKIPRMLPIKPGKFDIVHSSRGIIPITLKPWVMDVEHVHSFFGLNPDFLKKNFWKKTIEFILSRENCKGILCHCEATQKAFYQYLDCSKFEDKIKVLYPSSHLIDIKKKETQKVKIICILSLFYHKSGPQVLEAFKRLEKDHDDIELVIKSDVPDEYKEKYASKNIRYVPYFSDIIPRKELLQKLYQDADICLYPTLCDSFGYSLIDALVAGLPIVGTNMFATPEIVNNNENGIIVKIPGYSLHPEYIQYTPWDKITGSKNEKLIEGIKKALEKLISNKKLRERMGKKSYELISKGKFSIKERNRQLKEIYQTALK